MIQHTMQLELLAGADHACTPSCYCAAQRCCNLPGHDEETPGDAGRLGFHCCPSGGITTLEMYSYSAQLRIVGHSGDCTALHDSSVVAYTTILQQDGAVLSRLSVPSVSLKQTLALFSCKCSASRDLCIASQRALGAQCCPSSFPKACVALAERAGPSNPFEAAYL